MKYFVIFLILIASSGLIVSQAFGAYVKFDNGVDKLLVNNQHIVDFQLSWGSEDFPSGKITFDKPIDETILLQIPKSIPRTTNLDFGSGLYAIQTDGSWIQIKETESNYFYILEIPVNDSDYLEIESLSVATGRLEQVTIKNEECDDQYGRVTQNGSVFPRHGYHSILIQVDGDFKKVYYIENEIDFVSFDPYLNSVIFETKGNDILEIKVPKIYQEGPGPFILKNGEEIAPVTETSDDCFYYFNIESKVRETIEVAFAGWPGTEKVKGCETFTVSPLQEFKLGIPVDKIQCREPLTIITKLDGLPACVKEQTKQKLIERGWALDKSSISQIIDYLKQKPRIIDPKYVQYVETLALEDPIVNNFVKGVDWESQCCTYTARNNIDELNIKFVDIANQNFLRITFELDTLKIINIDTIGMHRSGVSLP